MFARFIFIFLIFCTTEAFAQGESDSRWVKFYDSDYGEHFYDTKTKTKDFIWVKLILDSDKAAEQEISYVKSKFTAKCKTNQMIVTDVVTYGDNGNIIERRKNVGKFEAVLPDSQGEAAFNIICNR